MISAVSFHSFANELSKIAQINATGFKLGISGLLGKGSAKTIAVRRPMVLPRRLGTLAPPSMSPPAAQPAATGPLTKSISRTLTGYSGR